MNVSRKYNKNTIICDAPKVSGGTCKQPIAVNGTCAYHGRIGRMISKEPVTYDFSVPAYPGEVEEMLSRYRSTSPELEELDLARVTTLIDPITGSDMKRYCYEYECLKCGGRSGSERRCQKKSCGGTGVDNSVPENEYQWPDLHIGMDGRETLDRDADSSLERAENLFCSQVLSEIKEYCRIVQDRDTILDLARHLQYRLITERKSREADIPLLSDTEACLYAKELKEREQE